MCTLWSTHAQTRDRIIELAAYVHSMIAALLLDRVCVCVLACDEGDKPQITKGLLERVNKIGFSPRHRRIC